jgi:hypothetical protein
MARRRRCRAGMELVSALWACCTESTLLLPALCRHADAMVPLLHRRTSAPHSAMARAMAIVSPRGVSMTAAMCRAPPLRSDGTLFLSFPTVSRNYNLESETHTHGVVVTIRRAVAMCFHLSLCLCQRKISAAAQSLPQRNHCSQATQ